MTQQVTREDMERVILANLHETHSGRLATRINEQLGLNVNAQQAGTWRKQFAKKNSGLGGSTLQPGIA